MDGNAWLDDVRKQYRQHKTYCERTAAQVTDGEKRDRDREAEFTAEGETRVSVEAKTGRS